MKFGCDGINNFKTSLAGFNSVIELSPLGVISFYPSVSRGYFGRLAKGEFLTR